MIQERIGHSSYGTTMNLYAHIFPATDDGVAQRLEGLFVPPSTSGTASEVLSSRATSPLWPS